MRRIDLGVAFGVCTLGLYGVLSIPVLASMPADLLGCWLVFALLYELMAASVAVEVAELAWSMFLPPLHHPRAHVPNPPAVRVAVLYLCCDDVDDASLASLRQLRDVEAFVLDDSTDQDCRARVDRAGLRVVRRGSRAGFKAGNLNHWLAHWGRSYDYFLVLDADSLISAEAVWELVGYLRHPENGDVAIVQSTVRTRPGNLFQNTAGVWTAMRTRVLSRLHERLGWSLSQGHNALHRTRAVLDAGGFDLAASCEDTLISLHLLRMGWRILTVDVVSYDGEPTNALRYRRRHLRWARQTVEAVKALRGGLPLRLVLLMVKHLLSYIRPACGIALLGLAAYISPHVEVQDAWDRVVADLRLTQGHIWSGTVLYVMLGVFASLALLQFAHGLCNGVGIRHFLGSIVLGGAMLSLCGLWAPIAMLSPLVGRRVDFVPTQSGAEVRSRASASLAAVAVPWLLHLAIAVGVCCSPGLLVLGFTGIWVLILVAYPVVLWVYHLDQRGAHSAHPL